MIPLLRKIMAFIRRDFQIESSYKMNFVMTARRLDDDPDLLLLS